MRGSLAIVLTARPSYAKLKPVIQACIEEGLIPDLYVCASALLDRYGHTVGQVVMDFPKLLVLPVYSVTEGGHSVSSVLSTGALTTALGQLFNLTKPGLVVVTADRHETLAASIAASYQNIPLAHLQGGEVSGNIDDRVRNANTALADYHFPATQYATENVVLRLAGYHGNLREAQARVWNYGCPSIDVARQAKDQSPVTDNELGGDGPFLDTSRPFFTVIYHGETERPGHAYSDMTHVLHVLQHQDVPFLVFWPGQDSGMEGVSKAIRESKVIDGDFRTVRSLPPERFLRLMYQTTALWGNSSTGIRECSYIGTPFIYVGDRQKGREQGANVFPFIHLGTDDVWNKSPRVSSTLYGDGHAAPQIAAKLKELLWQSQ